MEIKEGERSLVITGHIAHGILKGRYYGGGHESGPVVMTRHGHMVVQRDPSVHSGIRIDQIGANGGHNRPNIMMMRMVVHENRGRDLRSILRPTTVVQAIHGIRTSGGGHLMNTAR